MSRLHAMVWILASGLLAAGCDKKDATTEAKTDIRPSATSTTTATAPAKVVFADKDVRVPADFIEEATKEIDKDNAAEKLTQLEREIAAGP